MRTDTPHQRALLIRVYRQILQQLHVVHTESSGFQCMPCTGVRDWCSSTLIHYLTFLL